MERALIALLNSTGFNEVVVEMRKILEMISLGPDTPHVRRNPINDDTLVAFVYDPLPAMTWIRLLSFRPDPIFGYAISIHIFELSSAPPFEALSYTRGNPHQFLKLEHQYSAKTDAEWDAHYDREFYFKVDGRIVSLKPGRNLDEALRYVRNSDESPLECEYLWVDALCINQDDEAEQTSQTLLMGEIYAKATKVIAWLGRDFASTEGAIKSLVRLAEIPTQRLDEMRKMDMTDERVYSQLGIQYVTRLDRTSLCGLLMRRWFSRVWTVQEAIFAQNLVFMTGERVISAESVYHVSRVLTESQWGSQLMEKEMPELNTTQLVAVGGYAATELMKRALSSPNKPSPLLIMGAIRSRQTANQKDAVFGVLSVLARAMGKEPAAMPVLPINTMSLAETMEATTLMLVRHEQDLSFLHQIQEPSISTLRGCSSWTVDWSRRMAPYTLIMAGHSEPTWNPSGRPEKQCPDTSLHRRLKFQAARVGTIDAVSPATNELGGDVNLWLDFILCLRDKTYGIQTDEGLTEILWRSTLVNCVAGQYPLPAVMSETYVLHHLQLHCKRTASSLPMISLLVDSLLFKKIEALHAADPKSCFPPTTHLPQYLAFLRGEVEDNALQRSIKSNLTEFCERIATLNPQIQRVMNYRRLAKTSNNLIGTVAASSQVGDEIWVIPGMATPFVLRDDGTGELEFVGEAYVHGIMHGELANMLHFEEVTLK